MDKYNIFFVTFVIVFISSSSSYAGLNFGYTFGSISDEISGNPISTAFVALNSNQRGKYEVIRPFSDGTFEMPPTYSGNYTLTVYAQNYYPYTTNVYDNELDYTVINIKLQPESSELDVDVSDQIIYPLIKQITVPLAITSTTSATDYIITAYSGDRSMISDDRILIEGSGVYQKLLITPNEHKYGTTPIYITVSNSIDTIVRKFDLTVRFPQIAYLRQKDTAITISALTQTTDNDGFTYKSDTQHNCIKKYSNNELIAQWGQFGHDNGFFDKPMGIAVDSAGLIYVVDSGNCRIQVFTPYGEFLTSFNEYGTIRKRKKFTPKYIKIDKNDTIYVSENIDYTITTFQKYDYTEGITKAIIVAGGGDYEGNHIKEPINFCTNLAYNTLDSQGFDNNTIYLLSDDTDNANVDALPTLETIEYAITEWPKDADSLVIYFVDHGSTGTFGVNKEGQVLSATVLNQWLDKIQKDIPGKLIVVMEFCYSGSFIPYISKPSKNRERIVITSTSDNETAQFLSNGIISFSSFFWRSIFNGKDILQAFETARINTLYY
jgi:hypothetical protein